MSKLTLPEVPWEDIKITEEYGYYDGPTCGILRWQGREYYFSMVRDDSETDRRLCSIFEMTNEQVVYFASMTDYWDLLTSLNLPWDEFVNKYYSKYPLTAWPQFDEGQAVACFWC